MAPARSEKRTKAIALAHKLVVADGLNRIEGTRHLRTVRAWLDAPGAQGVVS